MPNSRPPKIPMSSPTAGPFGSAPRNPMIPPMGSPTARAVDVRPSRGSPARLPDGASVSGFSRSGRRAADLRSRNSSSHEATRSGPHHDTSIPVPSAAEPSCNAANAPCPPSTADAVVMPPATAASSPSRPP